MTQYVPFDQRHGQAPIPPQLRPNEVSTELQAKLWAGLHKSMERARKYLDYGDSLIDSPWRDFLYRWHVAIEHKPSDEFDKSFAEAVKKVRALIYQDDFARLYTFLEAIARDSSFRSEAKYIAFALADSRAAWRMVDGLIIPVSSEEEASAVAKAVTAVAKSGPEGAKEHLRKSGGLLASGDWAGSVRESIHAVESVACTFGDAETLGDALKTIQAAGKPIHPALARGFSALYGYTSDESGIRHALLESGAPAVTEHEALFMFGACASFCQYLLNVAAPEARKVT